MITSYINDIDPSTLTGFETKVVVTAINTSATANTFESCFEEPCCDKILVLAGGAEEWENDKRNFVFRAPYDPGTGLQINMYLEQDGVELQQLDGESPLGEWAPLGTWDQVNGQELYSGFKLYWELVLQLYGPGNYSVRADIIIGELATIVQQSDCFELKEYNCSLAENTVYFEWRQNGDIKFSDFIYSGMNFWQYRRVRGVFGKWNPSMGKDSVLYSNYYDKQVQDSVPNKYVFESELLNYPDTKELIQNMMLADDIIITDYNTMNHRNDYVRFKVRQDEIELNEQAGSKKAQLNLTFTDRIKNFIKNS